MVEQIIADLKDTRIRRRGLTLSGGDPLFPDNCAEVLQLCQRVKAECPDKDIWLWTGYLREKLTPAQEEILSYIDVLVDGPYIAAQADARLPYRGSANQRVLELGNGQNFPSQGR